MSIASTCSIPPKRPLVLGFARYILFNEKVGRVKQHGPSSAFLYQTSFQENMYRLREEDIGNFCMVSGPEPFGFLGFCSKQGLPPCASQNAKA